MYCVYELVTRDIGTGKAVFDFSASFRIPPSTVAESREKSGSASGKGITTVEMSNFWDSVVLEANSESEVESDAESEQITMMSNAMVVLPMTQSSKKWRKGKR